jgi:hypothetical protein
MSVCSAPVGGDMPDDNVFSRAQNICSYNVKQACGDDGHNIVMIVMHELGMDIHRAMDWVALHQQDLIASFLAVQKSVPTWGEEIDAQVAMYINGVGNWVQGNDSWSFESK